MAKPKKTEEVTTEASAEALNELANLFPQADSFNRTQFPKLVFKSQTQLDDEENVVVKAGTFFLDEPTDEEDEDGKVKWTHNDLGQKIEGHIIYHRKRLQMWDADTEEFYSTPMFDNALETIPLFKSGEFIEQGTPAQLKALYSENKEVDDKKTGEKKMIKVSKLRDAAVLYIIIDGKLTELTIAGSSMWSFKEYLKKTAVPATITEFSSTKEQQGSNKWNKMAFKALRNPTAEEASLALQIGRDLLKGIEDEKAYYAAKRAENATVAFLPTGEAQAQLEAPEGEGDDF